MRCILLDSNALLFALYYPDQLGEKANGLLLSADMTLVSVVSLWELAIKHAQGKLPYSPEQLSAGVAALGSQLLNILPSHLHRLRQIDLPQKDPFDALLVAQATAESASLMTSDKHLLRSTCRTIDATK